ncbi:MAG: arsenite methyltransferase [Candidatus Hodarchaeota archaeon]
MNEQKATILDKKPQRSYSCCGSGSNEVENTSLEQNTAQADSIRSKVRTQYAAIAKGDQNKIVNPPEQSEANPSRTKEKDNYTEYSAEELASIPEDSNLGLGSGNPISLANIQEGETVVDLGSGAGIDCFLASDKVGSTGKVIGIDMTPEMIDKARLNARKGGYTNIEFRLGEIENMPIADNSADLIVSNCVINLSVDKAQVFREAYRVLKPGGRLVVSDIILNQDFPKVIKDALKDTPGCVSRAWVKEEYLAVIKNAGFEQVELLEAEIIQPQKKPKITGSGNRIRKIVAYGNEVEVELTSEEDEQLLNSVMKGHIRAFKPN